MIKATLVIPCYNEQDNVREFYSVATAAFSNTPYEYEFIFVNDGSRDDTLKILKELYKQDNSHVNVISFSRNFGKEAAIYAGLKNSTGDYTTVIDADLQQHPRLVLDMLNILEENEDYDSVAAYQEERREGTVLTFFKGMFYKIINKMSETEFPPGVSDFRTMRRPVVDAVLSLSEYHRFSKGLFSWVGFDTYYMPYMAEERFAGSSKWSFLSLFKYAINGIIAFTVTPLKISTFIGAFFSGASILYMFIVIIQKIFFSIDIPGYPTLISVILLLGGLQLFILGIIGEYLSRTYIEGKRRPIYIEKLHLTATATETETKTGTDEDNAGRGSS
ncbi:MAG: glycosyltransferase family 2 protein [Clostridiales bacterium]|nr:glycosyltransferase family 2 protein [Clostridiales bacterium]